MKLFMYFKVCKSPNNRIQCAYLLQYNWYSIEFSDREQDAFIRYWVKLKCLLSLMG